MTIEDAHFAALIDEEKREERLNMIGENMKQEESKEPQEDGICRVCTHAFDIEDGCEPDDICHPCLIGELEAKLKAFEWRLIESAPRDIFITGWDPKELMPMLPEMIWNEQYKLWRMRGVVVCPTHWMPLREGPK